MVEPIQSKSLCTKVFPHFTNFGRFIEEEVKKKVDEVKKLNKWQVKESDMHEPISAKVSMCTSLLLAWTPSLQHRQFLQGIAQFVVH